MDNIGPDAQQEQRDRAMARHEPASMRDNVEETVRWAEERAQVRKRASARRSSAWPSRPAASPRRARGRPSCPARSPGRAAPGPACGRHRAPRREAPAAGTASRALGPHGQAGRGDGGSPSVPSSPETEHEEEDAEYAGDDRQGARGRAGPREQASGVGAGRCRIDRERCSPAPERAEPRVSTSTPVVGGVDARLDRPHPELGRGAGTGVVDATGADWPDADRTRELQRGGACP